MEKHTYDITRWIPVTSKEVELRGWTELDIILFSGDAYVDHPSFGAAIIARVAESMGCKVAIVPQPNWRDDLRDFKKFGKPRLFFAVTSGNMDSMINHYTANLRLRQDDAYTAGGKAGNRPDYATTVYSRILKKLFPDSPVIIGGIEASLRRLTHFDYWSGNLKKSILSDSDADLLVYGMGEKAIKDIISALQNGKQIHELNGIPQTAFRCKDYKSLPGIAENKILYPYNECLKDKSKFGKNFIAIEEESNKKESRRIIEKSEGHYIVVNPPYPSITSDELDSFYELPFTRLPHPKYKLPIPAFEMIKFSLTIHRGCFGGCSFCTLAAHQGKFIQSRSEKSILDEVVKITQMPEFKGYLSDAGGSSANMFSLSGIDLDICSKCKKPSCIFPLVCNNLNTNHEPLLKLYRKIRSIPEIKKITIGSGIRYDLIFDKKNEKINQTYLTELIRYHVSGRLKVAPEHTSEEVLKLMRKPDFKLFYKLADFFENINNKHNLNQQIIPYFISSHPGCKNVDMAELALATKQINVSTEQVQDFTPTPMTLSSAIYYTGINPYTDKPIHVPRTQEEKLSQRKYFFWQFKENRDKIIKELHKMGRTDIAQKLYGK
ncbi:MAG: YgiQ family radical SAM protein [Bacteroidetes bacterium RIFOXYB2_FULL_35_7]|nr:MAG: YgiQ family radical SAM protein [Bacteroidetes bacterium GWF2_35_48]OFY96506.1 MAG: YgiQ family radical SAM protein [Bacteroidetes bacterium RIFOXYB2_FULL_35_7]OFZ06249.1 MAG: YgiQ family radical SAM protein [Bacteroidetes bacterium RIFOXYC12_FULL_35_7]HBX51969.1 YgiQ family radical SAM protein [Bacteroidales bacterium]